MSNNCQNFAHLVTGHAALSGTPPPSGNVYLLRYAADALQHERTFKSWERLVHGAKLFSRHYVPKEGDRKLPFPEWWTDDEADMELSEWVWTNVVSSVSAGPRQCSPSTNTVYQGCCDKRDHP